MIMKRTNTAKVFAITVATTLALGIAPTIAFGADYTEPGTMTFSGSNVATAIDLQAGTITDEVILIGKGTLGEFTYRELHADSTAPETSSTCSGPYFQTVTGAGVFSFRDGSLLTTSITKGAGCINLTTGTAAYTVTYQITGGTGRFKGASGTLTSTATLFPVLFNASNAPELLTNTGQFEGTLVVP
jgi:hypothetical protein